jgi:hypothetical protein
VERVQGDFQFLYYGQEEMAKSFFLRTNKFEELRFVKATAA